MLIMAILPLNSPTVEDFQIPTQWGIFSPEFCFIFGRNLFDKKKHFPTG